MRKVLKIVVLFSIFTSCFPKDEDKKAERYKKTSAREITETKVPPKPQQEHERKIPDEKIQSYIFLQPQSYENRKEFTNAFLKLEQKLSKKSYPKKTVYLYRKAKNLDEACTYNAGDFGYMWGILRAKANKPPVKTDAFLNKKFGKADSLGRRFNIPKSVCTACYLEASSEDNKFEAALYSQKDKTLLAEDSHFQFLKKTFGELLQYHGLFAVVSNFDRKYSFGDSTANNHSGNIQPINSEEIIELLAADSAFLLYGELEFRIEIDTEGKVRDAKATYLDLPQERLERYFAKAQFPKLRISPESPKKISYEISTRFKNPEENLSELHAHIPRKLDLLNNDFDYFMKAMKNSEMFDYFHELVYKPTHQKPYFVIELANEYYLILYEKVGDDWKFHSVVNDPKRKEDLIIYPKIKDLNGDGRFEFFGVGASNMNGNAWNNIYTFDEKGNTQMVSEGFLNPKELGDSLLCRHLEGYFLPDSSKYAAASHVGSLYMATYNSLYKWEDGKLKLQCIYGEDRYPKNMTTDDIRYFFCLELVNGKLTGTHQFPLINSEEKAAKLEKELLRKYAGVKFE